MATRAQRSPSSPARAGLVISDGVPHPPFVADAGMIFGRLWNDGFPLRRLAGVGRTATFDDQTHSRSYSKVADRPGAVLRTCACKQTFVQALRVSLVLLSAFVFRLPVDLRQRSKPLRRA
jgi:hypothetical protein